MCRWICWLSVIFVFGVSSFRCSFQCDCPSAEAVLIDYSLSTEVDEFKVCFPNDSSARKDGVFYYTTPSEYQVYDCSGRGSVKVTNALLDSGYTTTIFANNGALFVNHHKTRSFSKKYCPVDSKFVCAFWITYRETYYRDGRIDTTTELRYPKISRLAIKSYVDKFDAALANAKTDKNFAEQIEGMDGFDYYGHADDLLVGALNGDTESEERFRSYNSLTKDIISKKIYSAYSSEFNDAADREFFTAGNHILDEAKGYRSKYGNN
jgi:hypothetical protein